MSAWSNTRFMMAGASAVALVAAGAVAYRVVTTVPVPVGPAEPAPTVAASKPAPTPAAKSAPEATGPQAEKSASPAPTSTTAPAAASASAPVSTAAPAQATAAAPPSFDVVRVEPDGSTVVAGRASSGSHITLLDRGQSIGTATADAGGQFVILPRALTPGDHELTLEANAGSGPQHSSVQSVTVAVAAHKAPALVALASPDQPTRVLSGAGPATPAPAPAAAEKAPVYIRTAEAGGNGKFFASGTAAPGAHVRLYLNNAEIAGVTADQAGKWSLTVAKGLTPGGYKVRADAVDPDGKVVARAEVPFDFTAAKPAPTETAAADAGAPASPAAAVVDELRTVTVVRGDSLWRISRNILGQGRRYTQIYEANAKQIRNQNLIYPGQVFVVPKG